MKRIPITLVAALAVALLPALAGAQGINDRQHDQRSRIVKGYRSDRLTRAEAARLAAQQARIRAYEIRNRHDGGRYTAWERFQTQRRLNAASRGIRRLRHNDRTRG